MISDVRLLILFGSLLMFHFLYLARLSPYRGSDPVIFFRFIFEGAIKE